ncbi:MAG TPA: class I SAM-dependent methyltransferase [Vicinamibacterales bacterium]
MYSTDLAHIHDAGFGDFANAVAPEIARILRNAGITRGRVVEFGCGSGTLAAYLHGLGYEVRGFDISPAMIRLARRNAPGVRFSVASLMSARIPACDAMVGVGEVITYVPGGEQSLQRFFAKAQAALRPGGVLVFDFMDSARRRTYASRTITGRDWSIDVRATFNERRRILTRHMTMTRRTARGLRRSRETHHVHVYDRRAVRRMLARCGLDIVVSRAYGRYRLLPGDLAVIARRHGPL